MALPGVAHDIPLFEAMTPAQVDGILSAARRVSFEPGVRIVRQGQPADSAFILQSGEAEIVTALPGGGQFVVARLGPGSVLGEMALVDAGVRLATVIARAPTSGYFIERDVFRMMLAQRNDAAFRLSNAITRLLCAKLRALNAKVVASGGAMLQPHDPVAGDIRQAAPAFDHRMFVPILPLFRRFHAEDVDRLMATGAVYDVPRGAVIFPAGAAADAIYIIIRGAIEITAADDGGVRRIGILGPGRLCGILAALEQVPHGMAARAREATTLFEMDRAAFNGLFSGRDRLAATFQDAINRELLQALGRANNHLARLISQARIRGRREAAAREEADDLQRTLGRQDCTPAAA